MKSKLAATAFGLAWVSIACGSNSNSASGSSSGGTTGSGSADGYGGTMGSGGAVGSGGMPGTGGAVGSGGITGAGGSSGLAGRMGSGGEATIGSGGMTGAVGLTGVAGHLGDGGAGTHGAGGATGTAGATGAAGSAGTLTLTSPDQADGAKFGSAYTCAANNGTFGAGVNPELEWSGVPAATMSFAITFIDTKLGATSAMGQHWAIWDIPASVRQFPKATATLTGELAGAMQTNKYLAPCPSGNDTYEFTLYALSETTLNVTGASGSGTSNSAGVAKVLAALQALRPLATATLHGTSGAKGQ